MKTLYVNGIEMNDESQYDTMDEAMLRSKVRKLNKRLEYGKKTADGLQKIILVCMGIMVALMITILIMGAMLRNMNSKYESMKSQYEGIRSEYTEAAVEYANLKIEHTNLLASLETEQSNISDTYAEAEATSVQYSAATEIPAGFVYNMNIPLDQDIQIYAFNKCIQYGIDYNVFLGLMRQESGFNPKAISKSSDYGLCQINACNHNWMKEIYGNDWDWSNPYDTIDAAFTILEGAKPNYNNYHHLLMAYNAGVGGAKRKYFDKGIYSTNYSRSVMEYAKEYGYSGDGSY